jgi:hypothetical protein
MSRKVDELIGGKGTKEAKAKPIGYCGRCDDGWVRLVEAETITGTVGGGFQVSRRTMPYRYPLPDDSMDPGKMVVHRVVVRQCGCNGAAKNGGEELVPMPRKLKNTTLGSIGKRIR